MIPGGSIKEFYVYILLGAHGIIISLTLLREGILVFQVWLGRERQRKNITGLSHKKWLFHCNHLWKEAERALCMISMFSVLPPLIINEYEGECRICKLNCHISLLTLRVLSKFKVFLLMFMLGEKVW